MKAGYLGLDVNPTPSPISNTSCRDPLFPGFIPSLYNHILISLSVITASQMVTPLPARGRGPELLTSGVELLAELLPGKRS